ncbi:MAG: flippase [Candidatus Bathyarchaeota archaeon]|nr:flippase [Candidatus Bathyarchaeota archaeon]
MTKAAQMAQTTAKGSVHLLWGLILSTVISAVGTIFIAKLLGDENYGLYTIAVNAPVLFATFRDWGINTAITRYVAQYNSQNQLEKIKSTILSGLIFELTLGIILTIISFTLSGFLANLFGRPLITPLIQISSIVILTGALISTATAAFTGLEKMHLNSIMLIVQAAVKTGLIIALVLLGFGTAGAVWGYITAALIAGLTGILLTYTMYKSLPKTPNSKLEILSTTKIMLKYGAPISVGAILYGFLGQFYSYLMNIYVTGQTGDAAIGNYSVALNFVVLITFFATPVLTMMLPAFSKLDAQKDQQTLKNVFQYSVKYASLIVVPVTAIVMTLAQPAIITIFQTDYSQAPLFLALLSISYLFTAFGSLSVSNLINGQGYTKFNIKVAILTAVIGFPLSFILISNYGVVGLIITSIVVSLPGLFISLIFIKKQFSVSVEWLSSAKILFSSAVASVLTYLLILLLALPAPLELAIGVVVFVFVFTIMSVLTRTLNKADITNVRDIVNALGPLRKPLNIIIDIVEKLVELVH